MPRHRARSIHRWALLMSSVLAVVIIGLGAVLAVVYFSPRASGHEGCDRPVRVVTATSFAPVVKAAAATLARDDCLRVDVTAADGRDAVAKVTEVSADVWIPDDGSWAGTAGLLQLAQGPTAGAGTVLAASPFYLVTDPATGDALRTAGAGWLGLATMVEQRKARLVLRDPAGSGDGMVAAGAVAEAVWLHKDMDASALWLADAKKTARVASGDGPAMPTRPGEVGIVPEYALLPELRQAGSNLVALPGTDHTAVLRYTWLPLASAVSDRARGPALDRLLRALTAPAADAYLTAANLRTPDAAVAAGESAGPLPPPTAPPFDLLAPHHVDHVFATFYPEDRRTSLLVVVDVSGSMNGPTPGSKSSRIALVRDGCRTLGGLLPDDASLGLWEFGSKLDGDRDYRQLLGIAALDAPHRRALDASIGKLTAQQTGTGLYDTILAAYTSARDAYRPGVPNQVLVFTDGRNESDPGGRTAAQLTTALRQSVDPLRPVQLSVVTFGTGADAKIVEKAVEPVHGYVSALHTADEVAAVFIHVAAGGLHH